MRHAIRVRRFGCFLLPLVLMLGGCRHDADVEGTPENIAREALGVKEGSKESVTEARRDVIVEQTTKVIDPKTGEVLKAQETKTPVTIKEQQTVDRDVDVDAGAKKTVVK